MRKVHALGKIIVLEGRDQDTGVKIHVIIIMT
jgi:hypothetical protein